MLPLLLSLLLQLALSDAAAEAEEPWNWRQPSHENNNVTSEHTSGCAMACQMLHHGSGYEVSFANTTSWDLEKANYWSSFQSDTSPACFVKPTCVEDVADILRVVRRTQCKFAVKSGGHAAFTGASNSPGGVTILLQALNEISLSKDKKVTRVGTGNVWIDVYDYLTPKNLSVVGGRVTAIGTGGLTLGGGISFFSGRHGWACDGIANYELVTADSQILQVNRKSHPDLYWALRGGGNNFGIVTRLDMETFPQGNMWGGTIVTNESTFPALMDALYWYGQRAPEDPDSAMYTAFVYASQPNAYLASTFLTQAGNVASPPIFANWTSLPSMSSTLQPDRTLPDLTRELNQSNPNGLRESYQTHTFILDERLLRDIYAIWHDAIQPLTDVRGILPVLLYQPLTHNVMRHFARNGGNALGVRAAQDPAPPLLLMSLSFWWTDAAADERVLATCRRIIERSVARSRRTATFHRFVYQNYAAAWQDVFAGYGEESLARLRSVSREWDPSGVFSRRDGLQPGYFKLWG